MPYVPTRYAPRDDWRQKIVNGGGGNNVNSWVVDIINYWTWRSPPGAQTIDDAWRRLRMSQDHAAKAFSARPPRSNNDIGLVPPEIASRVFARSLAKSVDPATDTLLELATPIPVTMVTETPSLTPPRYTPRADWQARLEAIDPAAGTWQADLARYWGLRRAGQPEPDAWRAVAMSPANARLALVTAPVTDGNDSGLIPCIVDGPERDSVARRVLARSVSTEVDPDDIYPGLVLS